MAYRGNYRGPQGFARPENALKRADELENVGQRQSALQALHDIITNKRHRTWSKTYESIMMKHIDLVVEMKKRNYAKEALMQYRNMCQLVNINSLEEVIKYFLKTASEKAEEAQSKATAVTIDVEDLEEDASPEDLMLSYVSAEKGKDRTDRELVTPWFRFLWEAYRSVLEILRTNPKLEPLYAMVANKAFAFCLQYKRTAEFRRLPSVPVACELELWADAFRSVEDSQAVIILAKGTQSPITQSPTTAQVACELELSAEAFRSVEDMQALVACELELWAEAFCSVEDIQALVTPAKCTQSPTTQSPTTAQVACELELWAEAFRHVACELELWAEAFRSVEDIQALIALAKRTPKQQLMATYYARLTQIFAVSENHMYHAYAWLKLFNFSKSFNKNMTQQDLQTMASSVLLSTLSILPFERADHLDDIQVEQEKERILRMATILGFAVDSKKDFRHVLSRGALLSSINGLNILSLVPPEVKAIHELLTSDFSPLELCSRLSPLFDKLSELSVPMSAASPVEKVDLTLYIGSLKQVAILRLMKQLGDVYSTLKVSSLASMVPFATFGEVEAIVVDAVRYNFLQVRVDHRNGTLHFGSQQLESERIRGHLAILAMRLGKTIGMVSPDVSVAKATKRATAVKAALECMEADHRRATARKILIEKRKEEQETALLEAEKEEALRKAQLAREAEIAEEKRRQRLEKELEERDMEEARALLEANRKRTGGAAKTVPKDGEKLDKKQLMQDEEKLDKKLLMQDAMTERLKEQQDLERKLAKMGKQLDHLERARREEEVPFLKTAHDQRLDDDKALHENQQKAFLVAHRAAWEADTIEKERLSSMQEEKSKFQSVIVSRREGEFEALRTEREYRLEERRMQKQRERNMARRQEYIRRCKEMVAERVAVLELEQKAEEEERQKEVEKERERKSEELAEKQRAREAEIEARVRQEKADAALPAAPGKFVPSARRSEVPSGGSAYAPSGGGGGGGGEAPPAGDRWGGGGGGGAKFVPSARDNRDAPRGGGGGGGDDRWGGGGGGNKFVPSVRREHPPPSAGNMPPPAADGAGKFVPPALRGAGGGDAPPPASGSGGKYVPLNRR
eukprot:gene24015-9590_t